MNLRRMEDQLILHEGLRTAPYLDTEGNWTIGVGYNITARGYAPMEAIIGRGVGRRITDVRIAEAEALLVLRADVTHLDLTIPRYFPEYPALDEVRQRVCLDMAFNMGTKALGFTHAIAAVRARDWSAAAQELYRSRWSRQVGDGPGGRWDRCDRLARMLLTGQEPTDIPAVSTA